ncbi:hypothetical protein Dsin_028384 [Dipteronia sinensis]|uniref:Aspartic peptidase DDI1-type domain-containing protein n=1 Tax=Dipteronia sinensis TaxID=43782 RepID=A0AAD9ZQL0_9ROSI|nr:hypothetical protein Dsin_028384 [Dipteronia sinensis]
MQQAHSDLLKDLEMKFEDVQSEKVVLTDNTTEKMKLLEDEIVVLKMALNNPNTFDDGTLLKIKEKVNAIISQDSDACDTSCAGPSRVNPLQLLNTISVERQQSYKGSMYVNVEVNGRVIQAMMDAGATNNFVAQREADRLGLNLLESTSKIKAVNSGAMPVRGVARNITEIGILAR